MVTFSAIVCAALLATSPDAPLKRGEVLTQHELWERLQDPSRSIFKLPKVADPYSVPRLEHRQAELNQLRSASAAMRPLRLGAATLGGGLMLAGGTYLASVLKTTDGQFLSHLHMGTLMALPLIPFAVTGFGDATLGHGSWVSALGGTLVGYLGSMLVFTLASEVSFGNRYRLGDLATRDRQPPVLVADERIGTVSPSFVPMLALAPLLGAVIGYELSSHFRSSSPMGPPGAISF